MSLTIPSLVSSSLAGPATVDFGGFTATTASMVVSVQSTGSVQVTATSANNNNMVLTTPTPPSPVPTNAKIPYVMKMNGTTLASGVRSIMTRAGLTAASWNFVLDLGTLPIGKRAGSYQDTITLTLTPN
jgi:hypothetical protein